MGPALTHRSSNGRAPPQQQVVATLGIEVAMAGQVGQHPRQPRWFTPARLLAIFCVTNLFVYMDRGLISSNGVNGSPRSDIQPEGAGIQGEFGLTYFQDGLLPAAFMIGLLISSPVFAEVCKQYSAFRLLGVGMGVWTAACMLCGLAPSFWFLMACRTFVGVGEASFVALAAPFIDDYAPAKSKAKWFASFYLCIPVGFALGYIVGGLIAPAWGWRAAFVLEGAVMIPFVIFALRAQPLHLGGTHDQKQITEASSEAGYEGGNTVHAAPAGAGSSWVQKWRHAVHSFWLDVCQIVKQPVWCMACVAYTLYVAVVGVYAYWGPQAGRALFFSEGSQSQEADLVFGGVTVITGVAGSVLGGTLLDKLGDTLRTANMVCAAAALSGVMVLVPAFLFTSSFAAFMGAFAVGQLLIFMLQAPVVAIQMWCVPQPLRALGASLTTMAIHLLGDVPSPPLTGLLQSRIAADLPPAEAAQKWRITMSIVSLLLVLSGVFFLLGSRVATPSSDFRRKHTIVDAGDTAPLLDNLAESDDVSIAEQGQGSQELPN